MIDEDLLSKEQIAELYLFYAWYELQDFSNQMPTSEFLKVRRWRVMGRVN